MHIIRDLGDSQGYVVILSFTEYLCIYSGTLAGNLGLRLEKKLVTTRAQGEMDY